MRASLGLCACAAALVAHTALATGPHTQADPSRAYLLARTRSSAPTRSRAELVGAQGVDPDFECGWRKLALDYGLKLQPHLTARQQRDLFDALELATLCKQTPPTSEKSEVAERTRAAPTPQLDLVARALRSATQIFVGPAGSDTSGDGTQTKPFLTLRRAIAASRALPAGTAASIELRAGTYYLDETIILTEEDSLLTIEAYNGEEAVLSGGRVLDNLTWKKVQGRNANDNLFAADLSAFPGLDSVPALQVGGARATLARYPNANPERDLFPDGYITAGGGSWAAPIDIKTGAICDPAELCGQSENLTVPVSDAWHGMYQNYEVGIGGACDRYDPPHSPWCSGNFYLERQFPEMHTRSPSGITVGLERMKHYKNPEGAVVHAWRPGHWYTWMFRVASTTPGGPAVKTWTRFNATNAISGDVPSPGASTDTVKYLGSFDAAADCDKACKALASATCTAWTWHEPSFSPGWAKGCYGRVDGDWVATPQDNVISARGPHTPGPTFVFDTAQGGNQGGEGNEGAGEWFVENLREELDAPNEYFYDAATKQLLFLWNGTDATGSGSGNTPPTDGVVVPTLANFIELRGSKDRPVRNVTFRGLTFRASRPTFMDPRGNPSGGDWSLERSGALRLEGTEGVVLEGNLFTKLDGNAVSINGYNRDVAVLRNEFLQLGQNAVASWGRADGNSGLNGLYPSGTVLDGNFVHEIGHIQKQSSFYFQAETALTTIRNNIVFNIPRAAINFNDGFGGGNEMTTNLLFNTCRESSDHGAFNSWDRLPYITTVRDGTPSSVPAVNNMHHNFITANYAADGGCLDNDDGSSYYDIHHNACVFGGHKSDFDGNKKRSFSNLHLYPSVYGVTCVSIGAQELPPEGYAEAYQNNTCVLPDAGDNYMRVPGDPKGNAKAFRAGLQLGGNTIYVPNGDLNVGTGVGTSTFAAFQADGMDATSRVVKEMPDADEMLKWMRDLLWG